MDTRTEFSKKVIQLIRSIPRGKVATYGQIAKLAGKPHGSRGVAWILHSSSRAHALPWQRVLNGKGRISFPEDSREYARQKTLLENEGVEFVSGRIDLNKFLWKRPANDRRRASSAKKTPRTKR
jgi:methylated-DNA-protein-cysteine methyltransferase-like protein